jgi:type II secretory pathway predicted ATPase ExeA
MEQDCGGTMSVVLAGHPKLKNDLHRSSLEEIGSRTTVFNLDGIAANIKRAMAEIRFLLIHIRIFHIIFHPWVYCLKKET